MNPPSPRICRAHGCNVEVQGRRLFCHHHWFEIPDGLRRCITSTARHCAGRARLRNIAKAVEILSRRAIDQKNLFDKILP